MKKRKTLYTVLACVIIAGIVASVLYLVNRGVPAVDLTAYKQEASEPVIGKEISYLSDRSEGVPGMKLVAENNDLALYFQPETTEVAVKDKTSGDIWYSNPVELQDDPKASAFEKELLASQLEVSFRDALATLETYSNFNHSISKQQFITEAIENGIRITYTLGDTSLGIDALPKYISKQRFEELVLDKLDETTRRYVSTKYYPKQGEPEVLERLDAQISKQLVMTKMTAAFAQAGYTDQDLAYDNEENGVGASESSGKPKFVIPLEYTLDDASLLVSVPVSQIQESETHKIRTLDLLSFFGAGGTDDQGYMFVPDGTGSLIYLNNGKVKDEKYVQKVYGADENDNSRSRGQVTENARIPAFGLKTEDAAWFAVIEKGDAIASITADISGKQNSYNHVYSSFAVRGEDELELYTGDQIQEIQLLSKELYQGDLSVRYSFLSGENGSYSGMAKLYQQHLLEKQVLTALEEGDSIPFYLDILGAVDKQESFLGVPYNAMHGMTTFQQASEIASKLSADGVDNLQMRYIGWFDEGVNHEPPVKLKTEGVLGKKSELLSLQQQLEEAGGALYPDVAFQYIYHDKHFTPSADAARFITKEDAERSPFSRSYNGMNRDLGVYYLLSPAKLPYYVDQFIDRYNSYGNKHIALRDLGNIVTADYRDSRVIYRETAKHIVTDQLSKIHESYNNVMVSGGNVYSWPYAKHLINVPTSSSRFNITDQEVPFLQMVLHGYMDYSGYAVNLADDQDLRKELLRSIELGTAPHFYWSYESSSELKYTRHDALYSSYYMNWYEDAIAMYNEANEVLSDLRTKVMSEHIRHQEGVVEMKYEDGTSIIVNYSDEPVFVNGTSIDALDYSVGGDGQ